MKQFILKILPITLSLVIALPSLTWALEIEAITKPSADIMLSFVRGGRVAEVAVQEGELVKAGQLLTKQENEVELLQLKQLEELAKNTAKIESVKVDIAQKVQDVSKLKWAQSRGAVTNWELDHAKLDLLTTRISLRQANIELQQAKLRRDELKAQLNLLSIHSPIDGQVEKIQIDPGESPQPLTPVIRVVRIDPLYIDVHVPFDQVGKIAKERVVSVIISDREHGEKQFAQATIKNIAAVADSASNTLRIRLELANPTRRPAGERITVKF